MKRHIFLLIACLFAFAGDYGAIKGKVLDEYLNVPLRNATVFLEGTGLSTKTDSSGNYTFPFVYVGSYRLKAANLGYYNKIYTDVIVHADQTSILNFALISDPLWDGPLSYKAKPQLIIFSQTSSAQIYTAKDIEKYMRIVIE